ncbi:MAG: hypothetical protein ACXAC7_12305 [Candidatus Hodarchaeales archaeon]
MSGTGSSVLISLIIYLLLALALAIISIQAYTGEQLLKTFNILSVVRL